MSGIRPFFLTGANAKVKVNGRVLAFCTNLGYSVTVNHESPVHFYFSVGAVSYEVTGSFSVIRYIAGVVTDNDNATISGVQDVGNGLGAWGPEGTADRLKAGLKLSGADGRAYDNLNPAKLDQSTVFDIEVYQQLATGESRAVARIRNCRILRSDFNLAKRGVAQESFQFKAIYADEDSFLADTSGQGQELG